MFFLVLFKKLVSGRDLDNFIYIYIFFFFIYLLPRGVRHAVKTVRKETIPKLLRKVNASTVDWPQNS